MADDSDSEHETTPVTKPKNRFRFQTFAQRISAIKIDVIHRIRHKNQELEGRETYFSEALERWTELNCTKDFEEFRSQVVFYGNTFNQLVHHESEIVAIVKQYLLSSDKLAIEPILDLVVQLARDLQIDFYKHFRTFFNILVKLLNKFRLEAEILEHIFVCLSYLFKFLWRYIVRDIYDVYSCFSRLLGPQHKEHINTFAAESFSFLMRKCKEPSALFDFMFQSLHDHHNKVDGIGLLLFEMIKGLQDGFHSTSETLFPLVLSKLQPITTAGPATMKSDESSHQPTQTSNESPPEPTQTFPFQWHLVLAALKKMFHLMADYSSPQNLWPFWAILLKSVDECKGKSSAEDVQCLNGLLKLVHVWIKHKAGSTILKPSLVVQTHISLMTGPLLPNLVYTQLLKNCAALLLGRKVTLDLDSSVRLINVIYHSGYSHASIFTFTPRLFVNPLFLKHVLPALLHRCACAIESSPLPMLRVLTQMILSKARLDVDSLCTKQNKRYTLDFATIQNGDSVVSYICEQITKPLEPDMYYTLWAALIILPNIRSLVDEAALVQAMCTKLRHLTKSPNQCDDRELFVAYHLSCCLILYDSHEQVLTIMTPAFVQNLLESKSDNVHGLRLCELVISLAHSHDHQAHVNSDSLVAILPFVEKNLYSPWTKIRYTTLRILSKFKVFDDPESNVFEKCLEIESLPITITTQRDRFRIIEMLEYNRVQPSLPDCLSMKLPLFHLISNLYVNFNVIWPVAQRVIVSYAHNMSDREFWDIYWHILQTANNDIASINSMPEQPPVIKVIDLPTLHDAQISLVAKHDDRPDWYNFRQLLLTNMLEFTRVCETHAKDFVQMFWEFVNNEYYTVEKTAAPSQNLKREEVSEESLDVEMNDVDDVEMNESVDIKDEDKEEGEEEGEEDEGGEDDGQSEWNENKKSTLKPFVAHLKILAQFIRPIKFDKNLALHQLYYKLLLHTSSEIQTEALKCILTYKDEFINAYSENLERLVDETTFKTELFNLGTNKIPPSHRYSLIPVVMRILFGKIFSVRTHKKKQDRQIQVFRFLFNCETSELRTFVDLIFEPCRSFLSDDVITKVREIRDNVDITNVLPIIRIQGIMDRYSLFHDRMRHQLTDFCPEMLQSILGLAALCEGCLRQRKQIWGFHVQKLKKLQNIGVKLITQFLKVYPHYHYSADEIDAIFEVMICPVLPNIYQKTQTITHLLKLFEMFSRTERYLPLLGKRCMVEGETVTPMAMIFKLLTNTSTKKPVLKVLLDLISRLLHGRMTPHPADEDTTQPETTIDGKPAPLPIVVNDSVLNDSSEYADQPIGVQLLLPFIDSIMAYIQGIVSSMGSSSKKLYHHRIELNLLSKVSEFVSDSTRCETLVQLLIPFLAKDSNRPEVTEMTMLACVGRLVNQAHNTLQFLLPLSKTLVWLEHRTSRDCLCDILLLIGEQHESVKEVTLLVKQLNSWSVKALDEPDYDLRLNTFEAIVKKSKDTKELDTNFLIPIINNCVHFISHADFSLRDISSHCLVAVLEHFSQSPLKTTQLNLVIRENVLPYVKQGIKDDKEIIRDTFVLILATLVKHFSVELSMQHLFRLLDEKPDVCFFNNIRHIQLPKRGRALRRLQKYASKYPLNSNLIDPYLMPLVTPYLKVTFKKSTNIQDITIETISTLCRRLPWNEYSHHLQHFLKLLPLELESQKLYIKLVIAVLDVFAFDLSKSRFTGRSNASHAVQDVDMRGQSYNENENEEKSENTEVGSGTLNRSVDNEGNSTHGNQVTADDSSKVADDNIIDLSKNIECSADLATKIHEAIHQKMIPKLHRCLVKRAKSDGEHKFATKTRAEDSEILAVPIALAMVKLLQKLPNQALEHRLCGILLKVCHFLKSRSSDIRASARSTLVQICHSLGATYLPYVIRDMKTVLCKGFELHVLCFTINAILSDLNDIMVSGDIDASIPSLVKLFNEEIFGKVGDQKEVSAIVSKLKEARSVRSYESYEIVARHTGLTSLNELLSPLKQILLETQSLKVASKAQKVLNKISSGLLSNTGLESHTLLLFVFSVLKSVPINHPPKKTADEDEEKPGQRPESCLLLPKQPIRGGAKPQVDQKTNEHFLIEFCFSIMNLIIKRRLTPTDPVHAGLIDPFLPELTEALRSKYVQTMSLSLSCVKSLLQFPLPSLATHIEDIVNRLFLLLKNYASSGATQGENALLVTRCFQTVTILVREVDCYRLNREKLLVLLTFCEEDMFDNNRQNTAFNLLKAILSRKLTIPELDELMKKIARLSVTSEAQNVRVQCRQVMLLYLLHYPLGDRITSHLEFFVTQLAYEVEWGRESALEMCATFFSQFPHEILEEHAGLFFLPLSLVLVNDDSTKCKKLATLAIKLLLNKVECTCRDELFSVTLTWVENDKVLLRSLATQLWSIFVEVDASKFTSKLSQVLPILIKLTDPSKYQDIGSNDMATDAEDSDIEKDSDQCLFNALSTTLIILRACELHTKPLTHADSVYKILELCHVCLSHNHIWVGFAACQIFGHLFSVIDADKLAASVVNNGISKHQGYLFVGSNKKLLSLSHDFCRQFHSHLLEEKFADQITKNLVFMMKVTKRVDDLIGPSKEEVDDTFGKTKAPQLCVLWLVKKVVDVANYEVKAKIQSNIRRKCVFKWIAVVGLELGPTHLEYVLSNMMPPIARELNDKSTTKDKELRTLCHEVIGVLKSVVGTTVFQKAFSSAERFRVTKRQENRLKRSIEMVANPELAARMKIHRSQKKHAAAKRKGKTLYLPAKKPRKDNH